jgi:biopolymer transport protein ExbD
MMPTHEQKGAALFQPQAEINITPMVDVMLVLLVIFMVTAPMLSSGVTVKLPQARAAIPLNAPKAIVIGVSKNGALHLGANEISEGELIAALQMEIGEERDRPIHLRGDKEVAYGAIVAVLDKLASNGFTRIAIVADSRTHQPACQHIRQC